MRVYFGIDGDNIGDRIESALITGDLSGVEQLSQDVTQALQAIEARIVETGGRVIFSGGDSLFAEIEYDRDLCEELVGTFEDVTGCTASAGVGRTPLDTFLAVRLAKITSHQRTSDREKVKVYGDVETPLPQGRVAPTHKGLIWLLGPGHFDHLMIAIRHHYLAPDGAPRLEHCWLIAEESESIQQAYEAIQKELAATSFEVHSHLIHVREPVPETVYCAVESVYQVEAPKYNLESQEIVADITGGLKTMTVGMILACLPSGRPVEYVQSDRDSDGNPIQATQKVMLLDPNSVRASTDSDIFL